MMKQDGRLLLRGDAHGDFCGVVGHSAHFPMSATKTPDLLELWHRRYGRLGCDNLAKLVEEGLVSGMAINQRPQGC